jgi:hypothetical protein
MFHIRRTAAMRQKPNGSVHVVPVTDLEWHVIERPLPNVPPESNRRWACFPAWPG